MALGDGNVALPNLPKFAIFNVQPKLVQGTDCRLVLGKEHLARTNRIAQRNIAISNSLVQRLEKELVVRCERWDVKFAILVALLSTAILLLG